MRWGNPCREAIPERKLFFFSSELVLAILPWEADSNRGVFAKIRFLSIVVSSDFCTCC